MSDTVSSSTRTTRSGSGLDATERSGVLPSVIGSAAVVLAAGISVRLHLSAHIGLEWVAFGIAAASTVGVCVQAANRSAAWRLKATSASFAVGVVAGAVIRFHLNGIFDVSAFCDATAPLIAGLFIGIVFAGTGNGGGRPQVQQVKELGLVYVLSGAVATAFGNIPGEGWVYGCCFLVVCGCVASSCYVIMQMVRAAS